MATTLECRGEEIAERVRGLTFGATRIVEARAVVGLDDEDEVATYLDLTLSDPRGDTWPVQDVVALRRKVLSVATDIGLDAPLYVRLRPSTDAPQEDDEQSLFSA